MLNGVSITVMFATIMIEKESDTEHSPSITTSLIFLGISNCVFGGATKDKFSGKITTNGITKFRAEFGVISEILKNIQNGNGVIETLLETLPFYMVKLSKLI